MDAAPDATRTDTATADASESSGTFAAFEEAQQGAIRLLGDVVGRFEAGMSERDAVAMALDRGKEAGFLTWFHAPHIRFGADLRRWYRPSADRRLEQGTLVEIDLGPATDRAFGDVGVALCWGSGGSEHALVAEARDLCVATCGFASRWKCTGELYVFAQSWANNHRLSLGEAAAVGHACLPREGWVNTGWPRSAWAATLLRRNQVQFLNPRRMHGATAIRPQIVQETPAGALGLSFEEMVWIEGDTKRILGRSGPDEIGRY